MLENVLARIRAGKVLLIFKGVCLGEHASVGVAEQADLTEAQRLAHRLDVLNHIFDGVGGDVFQGLGAAGAALVDKDQLVVAGERREIGQKVIVGCARTAVNDDERFAAAENLVIDHDAVGVHVAFAHSVDVVEDSEACAEAVEAGRSIRRRADSA